jgi:hypothetical protein
MSIRTLAILSHALWAVSAASGGVADPPRHAFSYHEGFEGQPPKIELWAKDGPAVVNFIGPSEERAFEGQRSLKLDVTIKGGEYHYWGVVVRVPCEGKLRLSARMLIGEGTTARVGFGVNLLYPPTHHSGCGAIEAFSRPTGEWKHIQCDLVARGRDGAAGVMGQQAPGVRGEEVGTVLDRWAIFVHGGAGKRAVVYLDDVRIEGEVPSEQDFRALVKQRWDQGRQRFQTRVQDWRAEIAAGEQTLARLGSLPPSAGDLVEGARNTASRAKTLIDQLARRGYASQAETDTLATAARSLRYAPETIQALVQGRAAGQAYLIYTPRAIANDRLSTDLFPIPSPIGKELACCGCRGEYVPAAAAVYALEDIKRLTVSVGDLKGPAGTIPAAAVDLRVVKCWYQAGRAIWDTRHTVYVPELLLKDDDLVRVDTQQKANYLRSTAADGARTYLLCSGPGSENLRDVRPLDAATLQPVDIPRHSLKQFWLTVHIPDAAPPGTYQGLLRFGTGRTGRDLPLRVVVHPFDLAPSRLVYSIYYRASLSRDGRPTITSELKSEEQYRAEMADLKAHGVLYPTNYLGWDMARLPRMLQIRKEVGLPGGPFFNLGGSAGATTDPRRLQAIQRDVRRWIEFCRPYGYNSLYFYGIDEATGEQLHSQQAAWKAVQSAGGKTFVACYARTFESMGSRLNCAVLAGKPNPEEARKWHGVGSQAFCYAYPQVGVEEPETYRRHYGLELWQAGFDGAMDYAYQHGFGHVWNDFDDPRYRDHVFAYPTLNGVVDTIQWEGFREGVDDVRYVTTLLKCVDQGKEDPARRPTALAAEKWLAAMDVEGDLDGLRAKIVAWILQLRGD